MSRADPVWCYAEHRHGKLQPTAYELLHVGRGLANSLSEPLCAVLMGYKVKDLVQDLLDHGADKVYLFDHPVLENFLEEPYSQALAGLIAVEKPGKLLIPASILGRSLAARLAVVARTGLIADATELALADGTRNLSAKRPAYGGNLLCTVRCDNHRPEIVTVRPMVFPRSPQTPGRKGEVREVSVDPSKLVVRAKFIKSVAEEEGSQDITTAEKIVSGGRGLGNPKGFDLIRKFAKALGAAVGASRATVDAGWIPYRHQVGLTGRTVRPKLYVACGISGQIQHLAGMSSSEAIVAVNTDPEAPMMKLATFSVEGDLYEVIPAILEELK